jgi:hypothetical protein
LKEEEVWTAEYRTVDETRTSILVGLRNHRPHRGVANRAPHEVYLTK